MGLTNFKYSLERRYSALTGQLESVHADIVQIKRDAERIGDLEAQIPRLEHLIASARDLLVDAYPDWRPVEAPPIQPFKHHIPVPFGTCGRRGMEKLRKAGGPMTVRQIAIEVLRDVGCEDPDRKTIQRTLNAIEASLRKHRGTSVESSGKYPAQWRSIGKPDIEFDL